MTDEVREQLLHDIQLEETRLDHIQHEWWPPNPRTVEWHTRTIARLKATLAELDELEQ